MGSIWGKSGPPTSTRLHSRASYGWQATLRELVEGQVAIAAGFFIIATMFVKYSIAEARHDSGVDLDRIGIAVLNLDGPEWSEARARRTLDRLLGELRDHPSIESASLTGGLPFGVSSPLRLSMAPAEQAGAADTPPRMATSVAATPSIFRTLGVEILRGRGFDDRDGPGAPRVLIVSESPRGRFLDRRRRRTAGRARRPAGASGSEEADRIVSRTMADAWVQFAKTANPNGGGLPQWPAYRLLTIACSISATPLRPARTPEVLRSSSFSEPLKRCA